jgi:hypothetical protein
MPRPRLFLFSVGEGSGTVLPDDGALADSAGSCRFGEGEAVSECIIHGPTSPHNVTAVSDRLTFTSAYPAVRRTVAASVCSTLSEHRLPTGFTMCTAGEPTSTTIDRTSGSHLHHPAPSARNWLLSLAQPHPSTRQRAREGVGLCGTKCRLGTTASKGAQAGGVIPEYPVHAINGDRPAQLVEPSEVR